MTAKNTNQLSASGNDIDIAQKIKHLQKSYTDFLSRMNELEKMEKEEINKILNEIDQLKIKKTMDKINKLR